uniref:Uncharacterized protein n=1 Tax=Callorhinchus milii TaxID=7868 RepID=A0A4W3K6C1_CALMI
LRSLTLYGSVGGFLCPLWPVAVWRSIFFFTLHSDQNFQDIPVPLDSRTDTHPKNTGERERESTSIRLNKHSRNSTRS